MILYHTANYHKVLEITAGELRQYFLFNEDDGTFAINKEDSDGGCYEYRLRITDRRTGGNRVCYDCGSKWISLAGLCNAFHTWGAVSSKHLGAKRFTLARLAGYIHNKKRGLPIPDDEVIRFTPCLQAKHFF